MISIKHFTFVMYFFCIEPDFRVILVKITIKILAKKKKKTT